MEIIEKQVEKVKEVPVDGCYGGYGYGRRDINGKANAGLTLGIIGTALGAWALFGNRGNSGLLGLGGASAGTLDGANININGISPSYGMGYANGVLHLPLSRPGKRAATMPLPSPTLSGV